MLRRGKPWGKPASPMRRAQRCRRRAPRADANSNTVTSSCIFVHRETSVAQGLDGGRSSGALNFDLRCVFAPCLALGQLPYPPLRLPYLGPTVYVIRVDSKTSKPSASLIALCGVWGGLMYDDFV